MEIKHIYWFAYFNLKEPSVRYRAKFPLQQLYDKHGITFSIVYPGYDFTNLFNFLSTFCSALFFRKPNSIIVFQKIYTQGVYASALKLLLFFRPQYTLYDIDDADYTRRAANTMHHFMKNCSACSVGSVSLLNYVKQFNHNVFLLTSPVMEHGIRKTKAEETFTIGWVGYYGAHRQSLSSLFFPALRNVDFPVKLSLLGVANQIEAQEVSSYFKGNTNISIDTPLGIDWFDEYAIYKRIAHFDVGVSPLIDNEFNRGKSAFKLKQCFSCGVPVLASGVGENKRFLVNGLNGYLCDAPEDFLHKLTVLRNMKEENLRELSQKASETFPSFSLDNYCSVFLSAKMQ